jgi:hypothetical protein
MNRKGCGRKRPWPNLRYYNGIFLEGLRKTTKNLSRDSRSPGRDLNPRPPEYESGVLTTRLRRSVIKVKLIMNERSTLRQISVTWVVRMGGGWI